MSDYTKPTNESEFEKNFEQIKPLMNSTQAYYESSRCLFCYDAPCVNACPTRIDIPLFIRQINSGNLTGSAKTIYESNYFGYACGKVCPTDVLCEGACVYNLQEVKPIEIGRLQSFATSTAISESKKLFIPGKPNGKKVAIIGAGPAGISCACELRMIGYEAVIFEAREKPSGLTVYGVAPYKITNKEALDEMDYLQGQFGFEIHFESGIYKKEDFIRLEKEFDAVFIGTGLGKTNSLNISGMNLENCFRAVEFIAELKIHQHNVKVGNKVIVLGGGNTAMDAASESARMGARKSYLLTEDQMKRKARMNSNMIWQKRRSKRDVQCISGRNYGKDKVEGVKFIRTRTENGKVINIKGTEFTEPCDMVIVATGQSKQEELLSNVSGITFDLKGRLVVNPENYQTPNPKYFSAGDIIREDRK
ncbi:MAG: FAD-dependent oxidoreductase [Ignavibacteria bacterium]|nr:FAD-dependent oxidoreductase [Ignavibacteria bacterium]